MNSWEYLHEVQHEDLIRQGQHELLIQEIAGKKQHPSPMRQLMLSWLGNRMIKWGARLVILADEWDSIASYDYNGNDQIVAGDIS